MTQDMTHDDLRLLQNVAIAISCAERNDGGYFRFEPPWLPPILIAARLFLQSKGFQPYPPLKPYPPLDKEPTPDEHLKPPGGQRG